MLDNIMSALITFVVIVLGNEIVKYLERTSDYLCELPETALRKEFKYDKLVMILLYTLATVVSMIIGDYTLAVTLGLLAGMGYEDYKKYEVYTIMIDAVIIIDALIYVYGNLSNNTVIIYALLLAMMYKVSVDFESDSEGKNRTALNSMMAIMIMVTIFMLYNYEVRLVPMSLYILFRILSTECEPLSTLGSGDMLIFIAILPILGVWYLCIALLAMAITAITEFLMIAVKEKIPFKVLRTQKLPLIPHIVTGFAFAVMTRYSGILEVLIN